MVECKYRGRVIGWLVTGADGEMRYRSAKDHACLRTKYMGVLVLPLEFLNAL